MPGRVICAIDLDALVHNLGEVRRVVGRQVRICAVVKADAYGHGAVRASRCLLEAGADSLAVASFEEARELRAAGLGGELLVLGGIDPATAAQAIELRLAVAVWDAETARQLCAAAPRGSRLQVHLKVDTGMHRIGAQEAKLAELAEVARTLPLDVEGVMSHLACADEPGHESIVRQREAFERAVQVLAASGIHPPLRHLANSAALLADPRTHFDMVRPGLVLYGCLPHPSFANGVELRPVMQLRTSIVQTKQVPAGAGIGYGFSFTTRRPSRIAVLPVGYAHGYPRALSNRAYVLVRGACAPVVGTVSMDHVTIDVTDVPEARTGDEVVLWGRQADARIDVMELGIRAATIGYELLTRVGRGVPRVYEGGAAARHAREEPLP